jgi:hypothetical protein
VIARMLESRQAVLTADLQLADLTTELNDLLGLPLDRRLELDPAVAASIDQRPREEYVRTAWSANPECAGINRHVVGDERALQERRTANPSWPRVLQAASRGVG